MTTSQRPGVRAALGGLCTAAVLACLLSSSAAALAQDTTGAGAISGTVRGGSGTLVSDVRVCALDTAQCAVTDSGGVFRLTGLRAGRYRLEILPPAGLPFTTESIEVRAGLDATVDVSLPELERIEQTVSVTAPAFAAPEEVKSSGFLLDTRSVLKSAGALQDVSRYVQTLPGVVLGTNDFRNDIIVRGGSPLENLFIVDNIEIPNINSFATFASAGGTTGLLDAEMLQDVTFLSGGYPAPFINRTSGVLQVTQREGSRERPRGRATLGFAGVGGIVEGPLAGGKGSWIVSARRSFLDLFTDDIGVGGVPVLYTLNAKAVYDLSPRDRVWAVNVSGWDNIRLGYTADSEQDEELSTLDIRYDGWRAASGVNWQRIFGSRGVGLLGVSHSAASTGQLVRDLVRDGIPPPTANPDDVIAGSPVVYAEDSRERETTVKYDLTLAVPRLDKLQIGGSFKIFGLDYEAASPYGNDTPYSPVPGVDPFFLNRRFTAYQSGAYLQATKRLAPRVDVTLGGRVDHYRYVSETRLSPRAGVSIALTGALSWNASYGLYYQQPPFLFLAAFPENRDVSPWRADHYVTGLSWTPAPGLRTTLEVYRKVYRDYPVAASVPTVSLANIGDTFDVREILFPLVSAGRGRATGVEWFVDKRFAGGWYGTANLAFSTTRHAALDGVLRPGSFDYPWVANVSGGYQLSDRWEISTRVAALGGRPYTPFDEALSTAQRRGVYDLTHVNGLRGPAYVRWDARIDRTFSLAGRPFTIFGGVQNLTNRRNVAGYTWNRRTNDVEVSEQQGVFPIIGFDWTF
jgi:hypothetical protein